MRGKEILGLVVFLVFLMSFGACQISPSPPLPQVTSAPEEAKQALKATGKAAWEEEWDKTMLAARKEGRLVVYTSVGSDTRVPISQVFDKKFGISTEYISARGDEIVTKAANERKSGLYLPDIYLDGSFNSMVYMKPAGMFDPLDNVLLLPEVLNPEVWYGGNLNWVDSGHYQISILADVSPPLLINTNLVKPEEVKSYNDLLNPKWKGKILLNDPTVGGSGFAWAAVVGWEIMGQNWLRRFAEQEPAIIRDYRVGVEGVARGKYYIGIGIKSDLVAQFQEAGAPLKEVPVAEGAHVTAGPGAISLMNKAPHPNAARVYINWLLSKEGATIFSRANASQSARVDVPTDFLTSVRDPKLKYVDSRREEFSLMRAERANVIKEIFGPLVK